MLMSSNNSVGSTKSVGVAILGFAEVFSALKPDLLLVLGDRYEIFAASSSAMMMQIPIMHLHGGERTEGLIDESIRHSVTKMAHIHCVSTEQSKRNVIQMGENPRNVHNVGAMGLDSISPEITLTRSQLAEKLRFRFKNKNLLVTFHPLTLEPERSLLDLGELLSALGSLGDVGIIFTYANADNGGILLNNRIEQFCKLAPNSIAIPSLGRDLYLNVLKCVDVVVGNSSSGIIEAPSFGIPTINIEPRQKGRERALSVIDVEPNATIIKEAIERVICDGFTSCSKLFQNPYGVAGAACRVLSILESQDLEGLRQKQFFESCLQ